jgi:hypothetical protein
VRRHLKFHPNEMLKKNVLCGQNLTKIFASFVIGLPENSKISISYHFLRNLKYEKNG